MSMKVLLRSRETGFYYGGCGTWVPLVECAAEFECIREAEKAYRTDGLVETELVLRYDCPDCELHVAIGPN